MSRTYIVPFDGSDYAQQALTFALNTANDNDRFILLNVQTKKEHRLLEEISEEDLNNYFEDEGQKILAKADEIITKHNKKVDKVVRKGYPSLEISNAAKDYNAYAIIMGSRGLSPSVGNALGSVTYGVIHLAPCPITIVPNV